MDFGSYQKRALLTDQVPDNADDSIVVPLLGLAGEAGELLSEYKKLLRDGNAHQHFKERATEELGDLLWYLSNAASKFGLDLEEIARKNLEKCASRWGKLSPRSVGYVFDAEFPEHERLPRRFEVHLSETENKVRAFVEGKQIGDYLTDNAWANDGYRFHDIFHLAYAAVLGWSPVIRKHMGRKRKNNPRVDEVEDGARAIVTEEGVSAIVFAYAKNHNFLNGVPAIDYHLLRTIKGITSGLEVRQCTLGDWEKAIFTGYEIWRRIVGNAGGKILVDLNQRSLSLLHLERGIGTGGQKAVSLLPLS